MEDTVIPCDDDDDRNDVAADDDGGMQVDDLAGGHSQVLESQCHTCTIVPNPLIGKLLQLDFFYDT